ncbi:hypothetical protein V6N13_112255 [Hibiscus sabdariffa]|uniref:Uncharacterized protein n=1 Tax=Hibiscus sabdariffa TaxID=183260 RepID=A0ABR2TNJ5_9ROSI
MENAAVNYDEQQKWESTEEEEEEALSLCDLPVNLVKEENQTQPRNEEDGESQEDFNFGSWGDFLSTKPEMCAADEVFFKGQILPFRVSVTSPGGSTRCHRQDSQKTSGFLPRSESMDYSSLSRFTSVTSSSRSSSTGSSHYSINSSSNSSKLTAKNFNSITNPKSKPNEIRNNFNTQYPSPKPQVRLSKTRPVNISSRNQTSSMWDFFRLGLVRAPELELDYMKIRNNNSNRNSVSRNSSCNSSNINQLDSIKGFLRKGLFGGCKCSVNVVETVPLNKIVVIKSMMKKNSEKGKATSHAAMEEKTKLLQQEPKIKKKMKEKREGKQASSRHRTYEWLKELSHASFVDEA